MTLYYFDTSALLKHYLSEPGSEWVRGLADLRHGNVILVSDLTTVEFCSALARRQREGSITPTNAIVLQIRFFADFEREYLSIALTRNLLRSACDSFDRHPLRSLDAIQLASAREARYVLQEEIVFVTADKNLLAAAASEGFATDDPNNHLDFQVE